MTDIDLAFSECYNSFCLFWIRQGFPRWKLRIHNLLKWRLSWGLQAVFRIVFLGCIMHLPLVISGRLCWSRLEDLCWSSIVRQWLVWHCDGLGRETAVVSHTGTQATRRNIQPSENCKGRFNLQETTPIPSWTAFQWYWQAWPPEGAAPQLTLAGELVLRGRWGYISEERHFDGIFVTTI